MSLVPEITPALLRARPLPRHRSGEDKEDRGRVLVIGGSVEIPGAALLCGIAALRAGAGKVQVATCASVAAPLAVAAPEFRVFPMPESRTGGMAPEAAPLLRAKAAEAAAVVVGPGMLDAEPVAEIVAALLADADGPPLLLDAAALKHLPAQAEALGRRGGRVVLTPHAGEMAGCLDMDIEAVRADPLETARRAARELSCVVALKGDCTRIASPDGRAWTSDHGDVGLATSGSGDVLSGVVAGLMARGTAALDAVLWGVRVHGEAGVRLAARIGPIGYLARELSGEIPAILADLDGRDDA